MACLRHASFEFGAGDVRILRAPSCRHRQPWAGPPHRKAGRTFGDTLMLGGMAITGASPAAPVKPDTPAFFDASRRIPVGACNSQAAASNGEVEVSVCFSENLRKPVRNWRATCGQTGNRLPASRPARADDKSPEQPAPGISLSRHLVKAPSQHVYLPAPPCRLAGPSSSDRSVLARLSL